MKNLPALTDFGKHQDEEDIALFLENLVFSSIEKNG